MNDANNSPAAPPPLSVNRTLRKLFLTLFLRGRSARQLQKSTAPTSIGQKLWGTLMFYGLFGCMALFLAMQPIFLLSAYLHTLTFFFLGIFVASSGGEVLFNREEADILLHRPIPPQALLWAKVRVLVEVSVWLGMAFNLVGLFVGLAAPDGNWLFPLIHMLSTVLMALFCTACVVMIYQLCLRWFGREKLESMMTAAQVVFAVSAVLMGQIVPQMLVGIRQSGITVSDSWWLALFPPVWFAGIDDALAGAASIRSWVCAGLALAVTAIVLWLSFAKLAGAYQSGMQALNESVGPKIKRRGNRRWLQRLIDLPPLRWQLRDPVVRASFLLTAAYLGRDRDVKLRVYPGLAPIMIIPAVILLQGYARGTRQNEAEGFMFTFACGCAALVPLMALNLLQYSQNWRASELFRSAPIGGPAKICQGARCAVLWITTAPLLAVLAGCMAMVARTAADWLVLLPSLLTIPIFAMLPHAAGRCVPLSEPAEEAKSAGRALAMIGAMMVSVLIAGLAVGAVAIGLFWPFLAVEAIIVALIYVLLRRAINKARWPAME